MLVILLKHESHIPRNTSLSRFVLHYILGVAYYMLFLEIWCGPFLLYNLTELTASVSYLVSVCDILCRLYRAKFTFSIYSYGFLLQYIANQTQNASLRDVIFTISILQYNLRVIFGVPTDHFGENLTLLKVWQYLFSLILKVRGRGRGRGRKGHVYIF